jgi:hypothetical protein
MPTEEELDTALVQALVEDAVSILSRACCSGVSGM